MKCSRQFRKCTFNIYVCWLTCFSFSLSRQFHIDTDKMSYTRMHTCLAIEIVHFPHSTSANAQSHTSDDRYTTLCVNLTFCVFYRKHLLHINISKLNSKLSVVFSRLNFSILSTICINNIFIHENRISDAFHFSVLLFCSCGTYMEIAEQKMLITCFFDN